MEMMQKLCEIDPDYLVDDTEDRVIIISRYDDSGNWAAFICKRINGKILCGGHMGLGRSMTDLLEWMDEMKKYGIEVVVDGDWFVGRKNVKKHPITIICEWLSSTKEPIKQDRLYYFIIDTNAETVLDHILDDDSKEILNALDRSDAEEHVRSVLGSNCERADMSNSELSDKIAYPFVFHGTNGENHYAYDWYLFWFNLTDYLHDDFHFEEINDESVGACNVKRISATYLQK